MKFRFFHVILKNLMAGLICLDKENSKYQARTLGPATIYKFKKISFIESKTPKETKIFRIKESTIVFIDQTLAEILIEQGITGIKITPITEGDPVLGNYDED